VEYPLWLSDSNDTRILSTHFRKKSIQWEPNCFMRTRHDKAFRDVVNAPKKWPRLIMPETGSVAFFGPKKGALQ
jgi:hypothetical protein